MKLKIDLHVHTCYSYDGLITPKELVSYAKKAGLDGVAVTDHDRVDGAIKMAKELNFLIIPSIEISSQKGHIIGLNLQEAISKNLTVDETIDRIHELGGLAIACHPNAPIKSSLKGNLNQKFDAVEVINASAFPFKRSVQKAKKIASNLGLAQVAGSDAHYAPEMGSAYTLVEAEPNIEEIVKAIRKGSCQPLGKAIPLTLRLKREILVSKSKYFGRAQ
ncbi:MAG: CehA/McbA family metallohydrolase [Nitrososphaerota archaeon]|nr:CehA/McbA family metallohydrolase [Candidatus Bathyarchaeota archaeon]MDW8023674.1 CehA/McbA family metallohydrolase [Nitrososphaerota archaeon]